MPEESSTDLQTPAPLAALTPAVLFIAFSRMALSGFGGVLPFAYRTIVERYRWLTASEFAEMLAFAQILPGPSICNLALMIGERNAGLSGALAAMAGMLCIPFLIVVALGALFQHYGELPVVQHALTGMSAVAAGLVLGTGIKMVLAIFKRPNQQADEAHAAKPTLTIHLGKNLNLSATQLFALIFVTLGFIGIGLLRWPLLTVVGALGPLAVVIAWVQIGKPAQPAETAHGDQNE